MATKIYKSGNYIIVDDSASLYLEIPTHECDIVKETTGSTTYRVLRNNIERASVSLSNIVDASNASYTESAFDTFRHENTGFNSAAGGSAVDSILDALGADQPTSAVNSTTDILTSGSTFTGTSELNNSSDVLVVVATDQEGTLYMEFSTDGTNWDSSLSFKYDPTRINPPHVLVKGNRYYRTRFTNDSVSDQTYLRLSTYYGSFQKLTAPINGTLAESYDAIVTRPTDYISEVALGKRQGRSVWNKFGYNLDIDGAEELIASYGGSVNIMTTGDTLDVVSSSANDTSAGTGVRSIYIIGIDENAEEQEELVVMNGTTPVTTTNQWLGINRVYAISAGSTGNAEGTITIDDTSNAVGVQATIPQGSNVTQQCIFHVPINHTLLTKWLVLNGRKLSGGGGSPRITFKGYSYSRVTGMTYEIFREDIDTDVENTVELNPSIPFPVGGREVLYFTALTDTVNTAVNCRFSGTLERLS